MGFGAPCCKPKALIANGQDLSPTAVDPIHLLSSSVVHSLLLFLQLTYALANGHTVWNWATCGLTLPCVNLKKSPYPLADVTTSGGFLLTLSPVFQKTFHFGTISRGALGRIARRSMQKQSHVQLDAPLSLLPLRLR
mmetsp:Transcript_17821/g.27540  ORF Transcript_17821/g.27540 Transcript_17821/m.27540 type:complete len:137 (-) Transcript_17821:241-651(-)